MTAVPIPPASKSMLTISEAADELRVHRNTAWRWAKSGRFPVPVLRINGVVRVPRAQLEAFIAGESTREAS